MIKFTEEDVGRFKKYVEVLPNGCHFWTGARSRGRGNKKWYGSFRLDGTTIRAHRFSCEALGGRECPPEHDRDHTCKFSLCVNEAHIEVVTKVENQRRKKERASHVRPEFVEANRLWGEYHSGRITLDQLCRTLESLR